MLTNILVPFVREMLSSHWRAIVAKNNKIRVSQKTTLNSLSAIKHVNLSTLFKLPVTCHKDDS